MKKEITMAPAKKSPPAKKPASGNSGAEKAVAERAKLRDKHAAELQKVRDKQNAEREKLAEKQRKATK
jgi:hypothetical protein